MVRPSMSDDITTFREEHEFLSNFWPCSIRFEGKVYPTVEHAFQAAKTDDEDERRRIREASYAGKAKKLGRAVRLRKDWESVKLGIMEALLREKFADPELRALLLATGERKLVEGNDWNDRYWGVCRGQGKNHLGKLLMRVREDLR
jgi:N-glycosidase YbiA